MLSEVTRNIIWYCCGTSMIMAPCKCQDLRTYLLNLATDQQQTTGFLTVWIRHCFIDWHTPWDMRLPSRCNTSTRPTIGPYQSLVNYRTWQSSRNMLIANQWRTSLSRRVVMTWSLHHCTYEPNDVLHWPQNHQFFRFYLKVFTDRLLSCKASEWWQTVPYKVIKKQQLGQMGNHTDVFPHIYIVNGIPKII